MAACFALFGCPKEAGQEAVSEPSSLRQPSSCEVLHDRRDKSWWLAVKDGDGAYTLCEEFHQGFGFEGECVLPPPGEAVEGLPHVVADTRCLDRSINGRCGLWNCKDIWDMAYRHAGGRVGCLSTRSRLEGTCAMWRRR